MKAIWVVFAIVVLSLCPGFSRPLDHPEVRRFKQWSADAEAGVTASGRSGEYRIAAVAKRFESGRIRLRVTVVSLVGRYEILFQPSQAFPGFDRIGSGAAGPEERTVLQTKYDGRGEGHAITAEKMLEADAACRWILVTVKCVEESSAESWEARLPVPVGDEPQFVDLSNP